MSADYSPEELKRHFIHDKPIAGRCPNCQSRSPVVKNKEYYPYCWRCGPKIIEQIQMEIDPDFRSKLDEIKAKKEKDERDKSFEKLASKMADNALQIEDYDTSSSTDRELESLKKGRQDKVEELKKRRRSKRSVMPLTIARRVPQTQPAQQTPPDSPGVASPKASTPEPTKKPASSPSNDDTPKIFEFFQNQFNEMLTGFSKQFTDIQANIRAIADEQKVENGLISIQLKQLGNDFDVISNHLDDIEGSFGMEIDELKNTLGKEITSLTKDVHKTRSLAGKMRKRALEDLKVKRNRSKRPRSPRKDAMDLEDPLGHMFESEAEEATFEDAQEEEEQSLEAAKREEASEPADNVGSDDEEKELEVLLDDDNNKTQFTATALDKCLAQL